ncbi:rhodanese-like domain-containing protein [Homoserinimonas sp. OAct 916]|uniref:rhodanese-like domain-containing protein n=1 Tax=Homoserinimonas sp. OAct 916 TaxID=2211450 RepID=UPI000DBE8164|nr:rhodanese-like domain-containing protein [Homoserinimonas sp. OAct 916]
MQRINARDLIKLKDSATIIDVREDDEYATTHVAGSLSIPMSCFVDRFDQVPTDTPVYIICASGNRSGRVTEYLAGRGFDATNIEGGIIEWAGYGGPVVSGQPATT